MVDIGKSALRKRPKDKHFAASILSDTTYVVGFF